MSQQNQIIIDSHVHLDIIHKKNNKQIQWMKDHKYIPVSWAFAEKIETLSDLKDYLTTQKDFIKQMNDSGLKSFFLSGVHPRNISHDLKPEHIKELVIPFLDAPFCLGIGEIGLEKGTQKEKEIFCAHLELGKEILQRDKCLGIHTPRDNKKDIADNILDILDKYSGIESVTVIDHCNLDIICNVLKKGWWAGITLSRIKTGIKELTEILDKFPDKINKIMCNSDSGAVFYDDFFNFSNSKDFPDDVRQCLTCVNTAEFFKMIF